MNVNPRLPLSSQLRQCEHVASPSECEDCSVRLLAVCSAFEDSELRALDALVRHVDFAPKMTFIHEGEPAASVYTVTDGIVRLYKLSGDGRRQVIGFAMPGDFLGLTMTELASFSADTIGQVSLCQIAQPDFAALITSNPHLLRKLHDIATHELVIAQDQMLLLGRRTAQERIAAFLLRMHERWARIHGPSVTFQLPMSRTDIGDFLGLTMETVSRVINKLAREKMILIVPDGVRLMNPTRLKEIAAG